MNRNDLSATHHLDHPRARRFCTALLIATASQLSFADTLSEATVVTDVDASVTAEAPALVSTSFKELQLFADTFDAIRRGYVEDVSDADLFEMAVKGMLTSLDPHSAYLTDDDYDNLQESTEGQFTGLGIEIGYRGGFIAIVTPIDGSPAIDAGLQAGDVILKIDGTSTQGMSTSESSTFMRGPEGTDVVLEIGRAGESQPFDVVVTRGVIDVPSHRVHGIRGPKAVDCGHRTIHISNRCLTGSQSNTVNMYSTGTTGSNTAPIFDTLYMQFISQHPQQWHVRFDIHIVLHSIDCDCHSQAFPCTILLNCIWRLSNP